MNDVDIERRAVERGKMMQKLEDIEQHQKDGFKAVYKMFDKLECKSNQKKIDEMYITHTKNEQVKQHIVKTITTQVLKSAAFIFAGATAVWAYFK